MRGGDDEMIPVVSADDEAATTLVADLHDGIGQQWCLAVAFLLHDCKFAGNSDPLRGIIASNSDPF